MWVKATDAAKHLAMPRSGPYSKEFARPKMSKELRLRKLDLEQGVSNMFLTVEPFSNEILGRIPIAKLDFLK